MSAGRNRDVGRRGRLGALALLFSACLAAPAAAHEGPPYPIVVDRTIGPVLLSVWSDPDVGTGTFHVYLEPGSDGRPLPRGCAVDVHVQPVGGRLPERGYRAERLRADADRQHYFGEVAFDAVGDWRTRVVVRCGAAGGGEAATVVAVTPPGQGPVLDFVLYLFPFVAIAVIFVRALIVRRRPRSQAPPSPPPQRAGDETPPA